MKRIKSKCAWCKIDVNKRTRAVTDAELKGKCPNCGSWNDKGQVVVCVNSIKEIYEGIISLLAESVAICGNILKEYGIEDKDLQEAFDSEDAGCVNFYTSHILRKAFLGRTNNSGGTSTYNLKQLLGIEADDLQFNMFETNEE